MTAPALTVLEVALTVSSGGALSPSVVAAAFDPIRTPDAARAAGRAIGEAVGEALQRRLQGGETLT